MDISLPIAILLIISGIIVGFINTLSAGGTAISISIYLLLGLPIDVVNATNRIGVLIQTFSSSVTYHSNKVLEYKRALKLTIPTVIGAILGARLAIHVTEDTIRYTLSVMLLVMVFFLFYNPTKLQQDDSKKLEKGINIWMLLVFLLIGFYGGFIQVGTGFFFMMAGVWGIGYGIVKTNAMKVFIMFFYTIASIVIFAQKNIIRWDYGLLHGLGCIVGSVIGSVLGVKKGAGFVKWVSVVVIVFTALMLFNVINLESLLRLIVN